MYYPTTTTATSGRFFVFGKGEDGQYLQPYVDGKIYSTFHTAFELWQKDYIKAIKTEKSAYTAWQYAENIKMLYLMKQLNLIHISTFVVLIQIQREIQFQTIVHVITQHTK